MAKAIFHKPFNYSSRKTKFGWSIQPSEKAQTYPAEVVNAAISAGCATAVEPTPTKSSKAS